MDKSIMSVFYKINNFYKELKKHFLISCKEETLSFETLSTLFLIKIMTICVCFHLSG